MSSLPASIKRIKSKTTEKRWRHHFPHYKSMGAFCCHGNQSFDPICLKTLCSLSPTPVMLHIKFDQDWPTGFRDIQVWKCGWRRWTVDGPLVYYKLTLWAFGSGELKMYKIRLQRDFFETCNKWVKWYGLSVDIKILSPAGCLPLPLPLPRGYIHVLNHEKNVKSKRFFFKLATNGLVTRCSCWYQNFVPKGSSAPAPGLYICIK